MISVLRGISTSLGLYSVLYGTAFWPVHMERPEAWCCSVGVYQWCIQPTSIFACLTWTAMTCRELVCVKPGCFCGSPAGGSRWMVWAVSAVRESVFISSTVRYMRYDPAPSYSFMVLIPNPCTLTIRDVWFFCVFRLPCLARSAANVFRLTNQT